MKHKKSYIKKIDLLTLSMHLIATVVLIFLSAGALRENNLKMLDLREKVFTADKSGENLEKALTELRNYVTTHMNADLPKLGDQKAIQLKYSYERAVNAEQKRFQDETAALSSNAKKNCTSIKIELNKVECEQKYIKDNPIKPFKEIYPETYSIEFVSPEWSFDLAGSLILLTISTAIFLLGRVVAIFLVRNYIRTNYK